jgi:hypothetical protein
MPEFNSPESIKEPKLVDLFSQQMISKFQVEGKVYQRKIEPIRGAEQLTEERRVQTLLPDGTIESSFNGKLGEWVITGAKGEQFVFTAKKFDSLYNPDGKGGWLPKERKILAIPNHFGSPVKISAPWSTPEKPDFQEGSEKCFFVVSLDEHGNLTNDRYIIGDEQLLLSNYMLAEK